MLMQKTKGAVVITGATSGIGKACAVRLDALGYRVFATYLRENDVAELQAACSDRLTAIRLNLLDESSIAAAAERVAAEVGDGGLDGLVNNAGVDIPGPLEFLPLARLREQLEVNVVGQVAVTQAFLPLIRRAIGRIVFVGSIDGKAVTPFQGGYGASKHAIEAIADVLRMELRAWGIHVSVIEPGDIETPIWRKSMALADEMLQLVPPRGHELYGPAMTAARATAQKMAAKASPPAIVVRAVEHALIARRPRTRYLVGADAKLRLALEWLPARWVDAIIMNFIAKGARK